MSLLRTGPVFCDLAALSVSETTGQSEESPRPSVEDKLLLVIQINHQLLIMLTCLHSRNIPGGRGISVLLAFGTTHVQVLIWEKVSKRQLLIHH